MSLRACFGIVGAGDLKRRSDRVEQRRIPTPPTHRLSFVALIIAVAVVLGITLGRGALVPAVISGALLGTVMLAVMFRSNGASRR
jgi:hypothetical protein